MFCCSPDLSEFQPHCLLTLEVWNCCCDFRFSLFKLKSVFPHKIVPLLYCLWWLCDTLWWFSQPCRHTIMNCLQLFSSWSLRCQYLLPLLDVRWDHSPQQPSSIGSFQLLSSLSHQLLFKTFYTAIVFLMLKHTLNSSGCVFQSYMHSCIHTLFSLFNSHLRTCFY